MSRFENYINEPINEKVSKKEISVALKNKNILLGCEYEMIIPDWSGTGMSSEDMTSDYNEAYDDYRRYNDDINNMTEEREDYSKETDELQNIVDGYSEILDDYDGIQLDEDEYNDWFNETGDYENNDYGPDTFVLRITRFKLDELKKRQGIDIKDIDTYRKFEDVYGDLTIEKENIEEDITYRSDKGYYEEIQEPYLLNSEYSDYINYMKMLYDELGYEEGNIEYEMKQGKYMPGDGDEIPEPPSPDFFDSGMEPDMEDVESYLNLADAPFDNYETGRYGDVSQYVGSDIWAIEPDESLDDGGVEIKSPPTELPDAMIDMKSMFDWMKDNDYKTNASTGFHCHMSMKNPSSKFDPLKLILFIEEGYIFDKFKDRVDNDYVRSVKDKFKKQGLLTRDDSKKLFDEKQILITLMSTEHFDGVNIVDLVDNHVEFRYMGSSNYHKDFKKVESVVGNYAHVMSLAYDPDYKKKEYIHKLSRIFNKMEAFSMMKYVYKLKNGICKLHSYDEDYSVYSNMMKKMLKQSEKTRDVLKKNYKLTKEEWRKINNNFSFNVSVDREYDEDLVKMFKSNGVKQSQIKYILDLIMNGECKYRFNLFN